MDKLNLQTTDLTAENVKKIEALFGPGCIKEVEDEDGNLVKKVDFDLLRAELGDNSVTEGLEERYRLDRPGKKRSILKANTPITKTLRPVKEDSVDWDTTQNLYIEGDNFEVLKILQESYLGKIKMIYIDPPYNTGNDFIYDDDFSESSEDYKEKTEQNTEGYKMIKNTDSNGRFHSDWLSMMYERLKIARDLLSDDGVIFISIDDNEQSNLKKICDEIFGDNLVEVNIRSLIDKSESTFEKTAGYTTRKEHEYLVTIRKKNTTRFNKYEENLEYDNSSFSNPDNDPRGPRFSGNISRTGIKTTTGSKYYTITTPNGTEYTRNRTLSKEEFEIALKENRIYFPKDGEGVPRYKIFASDSKGTIQSSIFSGLKTSISGKNILKSLFGDLLFSYPKPIELIKRLIQIGSDENSIILDFFSGSATTAHAVMQLNAENGGNRKFIMVQLQELCDEKSEIFEAGYKTICDFGKERIRRAGKKIKEETNADIDYGFRVYRVDESCMKDVYYHPSQAVQDNLRLLVSNIKEDRTPEDLLTQVILSSGLTLDLPIEEKKIGNNKVFYVAGNSLVACFDEKIDMNIIDGIAKDEPLKVVFRDSGFLSDADRINVETKMKKISPETSVKVI